MVDEYAENESVPLHTPPAFVFIVKVTALRSVPVAVIVLDCAGVLVGFVMVMTGAVVSIPAI